MRWQNRRRSRNVEDRRRLSTGKKVGIGGLVIAAVMAFILKDPEVFFSSLGNQTQSVSTRQSSFSAQEEQAADFASVILGNLEDTWGQLFSNAGIPYRHPKLVLYSKQVKSACGFNTAASGPFYCPADEKIYLDLSFLNDLQRLGAPGDFAFAYVIAHEYGHHVSNIIGTLPKVHQLKRQVKRSSANQLSVLLELQADCFAGIWANHANKKYKMLEQGDIREGLQAAAAVGDDALGHRPDAFTHGSSKQRMQWLKNGLQTGNVAACDTFKAANIRL